MLCLDIGIMGVPRGRWANECFGKMLGLRSCFVGTLG